MIRVFSQYVSPKSITLVAMQAAVLVLALLCGVRIRFWDRALEFEAYISLPVFPLQAAAFAAVFHVALYYCGFFDLSAVRYRHEQLMALGQSLGAGCLLLGMLYFIFPDVGLGRGIFFISVTLVSGFGMLGREILDWLWRMAAPAETILVVGTQWLAATVAGELKQRVDLNVRLEGFVNVSSPAGSSADVYVSPVLGTGDELEEIVRKRGISRIVVALEDSRNSLPTRQLVKLRVAGIRVEDAHSTMAALTGRVWLETVKPSWFVFSDGFRRSALTLVLKRALDLSSGLVGLIVSMPVMLLVAIAIKLDSKGPMLYRQTRVGLRGACFEVLKFRSMCTNAEDQNGAQWSREGDPRVTRLGRLLRKYRLDELPQFVNVIRGEMSLVGPRPERPVFVEQLRKQIAYYDERHSVRPGLTGWAQVQYQYGSTVEDAVRKLEYDLFYLKNMSVMFDLAIIARTIRIVLSGWGGR